MEFVTCGMCEKYFWAQVKFSIIHAINSFRLKFANSGVNFSKIAGVTLYLTRNLQTDWWQFVQKIWEKRPTFFKPKTSRFTRFSGKIENFKNLTSVKLLTNCMSDVRGKVYTKHRKIGYLFYLLLIWMNIQNIQNLQSPKKSSSSSAFAPKY